MTNLASGLDFGGDGVGQEVAAIGGRGGVMGRWDVSIPRNYLGDSS